MSRRTEAPDRRVKAVLADAGTRLKAWQRLVREIPSATPRSGKRARLAVGMSTYDDFDGAWFTLASILLYHPEVADELSLIVVDNNPGGSASEALKAIDQHLPNYRYVPFRSYHGTAVRDLVFREADADVVCCVDSHVLLQPGALRAVLDYYDANPDSLDLVQGPVLTERGAVGATHLVPIWDYAFFGKFATDQRVRDGVPFEIDMQERGMFACRKDAWPGFNPLMRGYGGEEGYLHEKVRQRGGRTMLLPQAGWVHRFQRPAGIPYPAVLAERIRNYALGWAELGLDLDEGRRHFRDAHFAEGAVLAADAAVLHPLNAIDAIFVANERHAAQRWDNQLVWAESLGFGWRPERLGVSSDGPRAGCLCALAAAVAEGARRGLSSVLFLPDDVAFVRDARALLDEVAVDLRSGTWDVWPLSAAAGAAQGDGCLDAVAVRRSLFETVTEQAARTCAIGAHESISEWYQGLDGRARVLTPRRPLVIPALNPDARIEPSTMTGD